ncbi:hypothetical protein [Pandoraea anhela]|uniref:hypothetical protein n=1 Tax=Pandoraea anhela TaxID=2508295 RepID=UPI0012430B4B|nr:hypothetical protein [Pandoraea anhela]
MADAAASLSQAVSAWPTPPSWTAPFLTALAGAICLYMNWGALGVGLLILALAFGAFRLQGYLKRKRFIEEVVADINKRFDSLLSVEISARPSLPETAGNPPLKAAGFAAVALVVAGFAWVSSPPHLSPMSAAQKPTQAAASKRHDAENASRREATSQASARRKDKAQSDATTTADPAATRTAPRNAIRASFDCTKAQSNAERIICSDPQLASADVELAALFANARAAVSDQDTFRERARAAWRYREKNCHDRECLVRWYADEGTVLRHIAQTGDPAAD